MKGGIENYRRKNFVREKGIPGPEKPVIFFDGVCVACNRFVDFLMRADARAEIFFSPMQGETAAKFSLPRSGDPGEWAIAYVDERGIHEGADAVLLVLGRLGGFWRFSALLIWFPGPVKEFFYGLVSRNRYRLFGKKTVCRVPAPGERERFLP